MNRTDAFGTPAWESSPHLCARCGRTLDDNRCASNGPLCDDDQPHTPNSEA
jgi:hypothetical protein